MASRRLRVFVTLTLPAEVRNLPMGQRWTSASKARAAAWRSLVRWGVRDHVWVLEPHADGTPHVHALLSRYVPEGRARKAWTKAGGGPVVRVQVARTGHGAYLAKDLTRAVEDVPKGTHRYGSSRAFSTRALSEGDL